MTVTSGRRAVVVHSSDEMYGADKILLQVIEGMRSLDLDVEVWLPDDLEHGAFPLCEELTRRGVAWEHRRLPILRRAYLRPSGVPTLFAAVRRGWSMLRAARPDVVYLSTSGCLLMAPIARLAGVRHRVVHIQERWSGREASVLRALTRFTTCRIAISAAVAEASGVQHPAPVIVTNCVDDPLDGATPTPTSDGEPLTYVVASRWNRWKGHTTLLAAWGRAGCPGRLVVLGGPPPVGDAVDVRALAAALDRPDSVEIVGEVADAPAHIARADVLLLPSDDPEPFGLVVIEAFAVGRPVIASRAGGPLEVVHDGRTGWFFEPRDPDDLARVLRALTPQQVAAAGTEARADYLARFHPTAYRERIAAVFASELGSG